MAGSPRNATPVGGRGPESRPSRRPARRRARRSAWPRHGQWTPLGLGVVCSLVALSPSALSPSALSPTTVVAQGRNPAPLPPSTGPTESPWNAAVELNWVRAPGAEDCASGTVIAEDIARRLGRDPFAVSSDDALRIDGIVDGDPRRARIFVRHPDGSLAGTRDLTADADAGDCHALDQAVALAIALVIDPEASLTAPPDAVPADAGPATIPAMPMDAAPIDTVPIDGAPVDGAPTEPADAVAEDATSSTDVSTVEPDEAPMVDDDGIDPAPTTTALDASAWFFLAEGVLPKGATGVGLEVIGPIDGTFDLHIALRYFPEVRTPAPDDTFAFGLTTGHLGACLRAMRIETDGIGLAACASMELGALHAVVFEPAPKQPGDRLWLSGLLGARLLAPLYGALGIELALEMVAPITRDRFTVEGRAAPAFQQSVIGGIAGLGLRLTP